MESSPLSGSRTLLRPVRSDDVAELCRLFEEPEIARWWGRFDLERIEAELLDEDDPTLTVYVIEVDEALAGLRGPNVVAGLRGPNGVAGLRGPNGVDGVIQSWEEPHPDYRRASIDIALATRWHGSGVAVDAIRTLARHLIDQRGHHHLTIDPAVNNARAIACYRKLGFRPVGVLRQNERGLDGTFHDTLLMDLLADELA